MQIYEIPSVWKSAFVFPLYECDPVSLSDYKPICNLSVLAKIHKHLVSGQVKEFLHSNIKYLTKYQLGLKKQHHDNCNKSDKWHFGCTDKKQYCAWRFIDLSNTSDTGDTFKTWTYSVRALRISSHLVHKLSNRTDCIKYNGLSSELVTVHRGCHRVLY